MEDPPPLKEQPPMTPATLHYLPSPNARSQASDLYDGHEFKALTSHLRQALATPWRLSPKSSSGGGGGGSSTLYDSYELKAVTKQLNAALRAARTSTSPYTSPRCLNHLKKAKKLKRIAGLHKSHDSGENSSGEKARGLLLKMWKKLKLAVLQRQ